MTELANTEVQLSAASGTTGARKPFVAPTVEHLGRLETSTLLTGGGGI